MTLEMGLDIAFWVAIAYAARGLYRLGRSRRQPECNCCATHTRHGNPCRDMENCRCCERRCPVHTKDLPEARVRRRTW